MADVSSYSFTGHLGADAIVRTTPNGKHCMEMSVAISTGYGDYKKTLWVKVKQWGERVNNIVDIFKKGSLVGGTGEISVNEWQDKTSGDKHTDIEVTCMSVQLLNGKQPSKPSDTSEPELGDGVVF